MNHQDNQKPACKRVADMLDGTVKEGLYRVEPELKNPRKFLEATQEAQQVALRTLYEDKEVRSPISQGAMECHITTALWKKYFPHGRGSPAEPLRAFCEELCPNPDQRWACYLNRRLKEEEDRNPRSQKRPLEESIITSTPPSPYKTAQNLKQVEAAVTETNPQLLSSPRKTPRAGTDASDPNGKGKPADTQMSLASTTHTSTPQSPPKPEVSQLRSPTLYQDILTAKCLQERMGVRWFPSDDNTNVKAVLIGDVYVAASATFMRDHTVTEVKEELARKILDTCSEMRLYCISRTRKRETWVELQRLLS
ncbi:uncharacterized protein B0T23DRAFT_327791 [Neurospora hispaniola]|uniref:Uncharacterized protein n=1 Tax=Neurospora hispaniola TaxID=588809 RepID=A0AAJ0HY99_9PEZI|nr:hypothetical protein B0T23DRAFT_327791 [Neurospora hispaniola]